MSRADNLEWIPSAGRWWRASRYEIVAGMIRPARDATIEAFDPWEIYRGTRAKGYEFCPPYASLTNLGLDLARSVPEAERQIVKWCERYGLLGLLPHQIRMATLSPRWVEIEGDPAFLVPEQVQFIRSNRGWSCRRTLIRPPKIVDLSSGQRGQLVPRKVSPEAWARVSALRQDLRSSEISSQSLRESFGRYFPDVSSDEANDFAYPAPLSDAFWRSYSEPYGDFLNGLQCLAEALWSLGLHRESEERQDQLNIDRVSEGVDLLDALLSPASPTIVPGPQGRFDQQWVCGSLLCAFAMMALQDLAEGRHIRPCITCSRLFVSQHPAALYCSRQCRWKVQKRRQRGGI